MKGTAPPPPSFPDAWSSGDGSSSSRANHRPVCRFGRGCYQRNRNHFLQYAHPWLEEEQTEDNTVLSNNIVLPPSEIDLPGMSTPAPSFALNNSRPTAWEQFAINEGLSINSEQPDLITGPSVMFGIDEDDERTPRTTSAWDQDSTPGSLSRCQTPQGRYISSGLLGPERGVSQPFLQPSVSQLSVQSLASNRSLHSTISEDVTSRRSRSRLVVEDVADSRAASKEGEQPNVSPAMSTSSDLQPRRSPPPPDDTSGPRSAASQADLVSGPSQPTKAPSVLDVSQPRSLPTGTAAGFKSSDAAVRTAVDAALRSFHAPSVKGVFTPLQGAAALVTIATVSVWSFNIVLLVVPIIQF